MSKSFLFVVAVLLLTLLLNVVAAPTTSPSASPSLSPVNAPTTSPVNAPTASPIANTKAPVIANTPTASPIVVVTKSPVTTPTLPCRPAFSLNKAQCRKRVKQCNPAGSTMKWTSMGCFWRIKGRVRRANDGGCQCKGYCGYTCKRACSLDRECIWDGISCRVLATGKVGQAITDCAA